MIDVVETESEGSWGPWAAQHSDASIFHSVEWKNVIGRVLPHRHRYLVAKRAGAIVGILPLVVVSSMLFGTSLISVPFGVYGGVVGDDDESRRALLDRARRIAADCGAKYVELRHSVSPFAELPKSSLYSTFIADVPETHDACLERIPRKARAEVRKALKDEQLTFVEDPGSIGRLFDLFSINKRSLGSPIFPFALFEEAAAAMKGRVYIHSVMHAGRAIATVMSFAHRGTIMPYYSGTAPGAERMSASNFMYFRLMEWALDNGFKKFDFGRSREGTGAYAFKRHQGFEPTPLAYDYVLVKARALPSLNPSNPKFDLAKRIFSSMPLGIARLVGAYVSRRAPF